MTRVLLVLATWLATIASILSSKSIFSLSKSNIELYVLENGESTLGEQIRFDKELCTSVSNSRDLGKLVATRMDDGRLDNGDWELFSKYGVLARGCADLDTFAADKSGTTEEGEAIVHIVRSDQLFMWPFYHNGDVITLKHAIGGDGVSPVQLEPIHKSLEGTRVFRLRNFLSADEADKLIEYSLNITDADFKLKRSTTGTTPGLNSKRTSENAFDTKSPTAIALKKRSFEVLGIPDFDDRMTDGLQVLRYNVSQAYVTHMDYFSHLSQVEKKHHNYDSWEPNGSNRYATVLLYLTDVEDGGETVFPHASATSPPHESTGDLSLPEDPTEAELAEQAEVDEYISREGLDDFFPQDGWERDMVRVCRSKQSLAVRPMRAEAVLFYNQVPGGEPDPMSLHGACPVLRGQKWAANLWVWNRPRNSFWFLDKSTNTLTLKPENLERNFLLVLADDMPEVSLYFNVAGMEEDAPNDDDNTLFSAMKAGDRQSIQTYVGHRFSLHMGPDNIKVWEARIGVSEEEQYHFVSRSDLSSMDEAYDYNDDEVVEGVEGTRRKASVSTGGPDRKMAFVLTKDVPCGGYECSLFYEDSFFTKLNPSEKYGVNTFVGHRWTVHVDGFPVWVGTAGDGFGPGEDQTVFISGKMARDKISQIQEEGERMEEEVSAI